jgi:hypothetical protein
MSAHPPPVPPDQISDKEPAASHETGGEAKAGHGGPRDPNLSEQGRQGNIKQNTTNTGLQQDR